MTIDWEHFTLVNSLSGGLLIGLAAALLIMLNGKIAGISGILGGILSAPSQDKVWRIAFIIGLMISPTIWKLMTALPTIDVSQNPTMLIVAGLIVGIGTRIGSGCTSGHGVCGISRFSKRSIIATITFMVFGIITSYVIRHLFA